MDLSSSNLKRYRAIAKLLMKHRAAGSRPHMVDDPHLVSNQKPDRAAELPDELEKLGPTFVKLGQLLSSRTDLLPDHYLKHLSRLQDKVEPFPFEDVQRTIEAELGVKLSKAFSTFEREPLAAASLGQVHLAALHDCRPVAVKVQRPGISGRIERDFEALRRIARFVERHTESGQRYQVRSILEEFEISLAHELDYRREASNMVALGRTLAKFDQIHVPAPVNDYTTRKVLTMDYVRGTKITKLSPLVRLDINGAALAEDLFRAYLQQILVDGMFHADPHPGNIFLTEDNRIALLDVGMVGHTTPGMQEHLLKLLLAVSEGESEQAAEIAVRISEPRQNFDESLFRKRIGQIVSQQKNSTLQDIDVGGLLLDLNRAAADSGLYVPTELSLLGKTLLQLDQVGKILDPKFDPTDSIRRNARQILHQRLRSVLTEGKLFSAMLEAKQFLSAFPSRLNRILDAVGKAEVNVNVRPKETEVLLETVQKLGNRITTGLVLAALIVGAALLMQVQTSFEIFGYPGLAMLCFLAAAIGGFWLVITILWQDHRTRHRSRE